MSSMDFDSSAGGLQELVTKHHRDHPASVNYRSCCSAAESESVMPPSGQTSRAVASYAATDRPRPQIVLAVKSFPEERGMGALPMWAVVLGATIVFVMLVYFFG